MTIRLIQIGDEIVSETKLFDWCLRHIDGTKEVFEAPRPHADPEQVKPAVPAPRRPPARFSPEVIDFE